MSEYLLPADWTPKPKANNVIDHEGNHFGKMILPRTKKLDKWMNQILGHSHYHSFYFPGPPASGKTACLELIASRLIQSQYSVYLIDSADFLDRVEQKHIDALENAHPDKLALVIDEVQTNVKSYLWLRLLRKTKCIVVAAGISSEFTSSPHFQKTFAATELFFEEDEVDEIVENFAVACNDRKAVSYPDFQKVVREISQFLLMFTGGHVFSFISLLDFILTDDMFFEHMADYAVYFRGATFLKTEKHSMIASRCLGSYSFVVKGVILGVISTGRTSLEDISLLMMSGWWNQELKWISSDYLLCHILFSDTQNWSRRSNVEKKIKDRKDIEDQLELLIVAGLQGMLESDFTDGEVSKLENAIGFVWGHNIRQKFPEIFVAPQTRTEEAPNPPHFPSIDYTFDGTLDCAIELSRNHWQINEKLKKIGPDGVYKQWHNRSVILNFQVKDLKGKRNDNPLVYHFVKSENILYKGNTPILHDVVNSLPTPQLTTKMKVLLQDQSKKRKFMFEILELAMTVKQATQNRAIEAARIAEAGSGDRTTFLELGGPKIVTAKRAKTAKKRTVKELYEESFQPQQFY